MRLEINISDERPEARILSAASDPSAYLLELVRIDRGSSLLGMANGKPDYVQIFADAKNCPSAFRTREEIDNYVDQLRDDW